MKSLYRNPEVKRITLEITILFLLFSIFTYCFVQYRLKNFSKGLINQNIAVVGTVLSKYPEMEEDIIKCYTKNIPEEVFKKGEKVLKGYGYSKYTRLESMPIVKEFNKNYFMNIVLIQGTFLVLLICIIIFEYSIIFKKIKKISNAAEKVVEGDFSIKLREENEGQFSMLAHEFNQMADRLENSIDSLKKEKKFLKDIISDISHQLKTPLSCLMVFNELLIEGTVKDEENKMNFHYKSKLQLERMEWLIKNLLKIAKIEAKTVEFEKNNLPLKITIMKAIAPLKVKLKEKDQSIDVNINDDIIFKHDVNWTAEAVTNIVKNCIEHTQENGKICIEAFETPLCVSIKIKDNGQGISKEDLPHIFERFYKGRKNKNSDSVGIGLALCRAIIEGQEGSVEARSPKGQGAEFNINFLKIL